MSHSKAFVALPSLRPTWKQLRARFVEALKVEAEKRGEGWEFVLSRGRGVEEEMLGYAHIPFSLSLSWAPEKKVTRIRCHRLLVPVFEVLFQELEEGGLRPLVRTYGGCFCFRRMRGGGHLSIHSWGIAIDLNPDTNRLGTPGDMAPELVELFENFGFTWGGIFSRPDPMHFQFCSGY